MTDATCNPTIFKLRVTDEEPVWDSLEIDSRFLSPLSYSAMVPLSDKEIAIIGGAHPRDWSNDLTVLNTETNEAEKMQNMCVFGFFALSN